MAKERSMCRCGEAGAPTKPVQFRVSGPYTATQYRKRIVMLCAECRKGKANRGLIRIVKDPAPPK